MKKNTKISYKNFINKKYFQKKNSNNFSKIVNNILENVDISKNNFHTLSKKFKFNFKIEEIKKFRKFERIVIIGMGGSILGTKAIYYFFKKKIKKKFIFLDNINEFKLHNLKKNYNLKKILFIVVSKSGNTVETISNFLALNIIKYKSKNIIIISEKNDNTLYSLAQKNKIFFVEHKGYIGGRYSVLSEVGMLPAYLMGVNILEIRKELTKHLTLKKKNFLKNSSIKLSNLLIKSDIKDLIFFNYVPELNEFLFWCQQLIAESLGKNKKGFFPSISPAPKDHHSTLQLYLDGPKNKIFYIFSSEIKSNQKINIKSFTKNMNFLHHKSLSQIKLAQKNAFIKILKKKGIPFREFILKKFDEEVLGELFSYFILETAIIGKLAKINPFNQPAVEQIKINTKKILK